jgi:hypothetical protein
MLKPATSGSFCTASGKRPEGANWAISITWPKPCRNAAGNRGVTVVARHNLGGGSCGCPAGKVGAIRRFKRITSASGVSPVSVACCAERLWPNMRGVPKCRRDPSR